jgi:hypothetical protein
MRKQDSEWADPDTAWPILRVARRNRYKVSPDGKYQSPSPRLFCNEDASHSGNVDRASP